MTANDAKVQYVSQNEHIQHTVQLSDMLRAATVNSVQVHEGAKEQTHHITTAAGLTRDNVGSDEV